MHSGNIEKTEYNARWRDESYSARNVGYSDNFVKFMRKWGMPSATGQCALDVGCGDGYFSGQLSGIGYQVTGIDLSDVAVREASKEFPKCKFLVHDISRRFPFDDNSFDIIWCSENLEHLFSPLDALKEICRVLKPGSRLLATVPYHGLIKNLGIALFAFDRHYDPTYPHIRFFTKNTLCNIAQGAGFSVIAMGSCGSNLGLRDLIVPTNILMVAEKPDLT